MKDKAERRASVWVEPWLGCSGGVIPEAWKDREPSVADGAYPQTVLISRRLIPTMFGRAPHARSRARRRRNLDPANRSTRSTSKRKRNRRPPFRLASLETLETRNLLAVDAVTPDFFVPRVEDGFVDPGIVDVTNWNSDPALNADPAAGNNDHAALQAAINAFTGTNRILFIPAGEYEIDEPLVFPVIASNSATTAAIIQGQNRDSVTIKFSDDLGVGGAVLEFQTVVAANAFRNAVRDLTIDIGSGNPDADGLRFVGNNQATVSNVHIRSTDPEWAGDTGLELGIGENGPLLVENVSVDGFNTGIRTAFQTASQTFENVLLTNQQRYGWVNESVQNVFARNVTSINEVSAIQNFPINGVGQNAVFTIVDSNLQGVGDAINETAIRSEERLYARNVTTTGYGRPVSYTEANGFISGNRDLEGDFIEEYWTEGTEDNIRVGGTHELFDGSPDTTLQLQAEPVPMVPLEPDFSRWASPTSFVTTNFDGTPSGIADDVFDDSAAIQAAIDSGATTLYFPSAGLWLIEDLVEVRGNVERIFGLEASLRSLTGDGRFRFGDEGPDTVVIERIAGGSGQPVGYQHASDRTLVFRSMVNLAYEPIVEAPGDVFINDVVNSHYTFRNQNVWARQLNVEGIAEVNDPDFPDQKILNDNANLWVLGLKIEQEGTVVRTINGGRSDILGVYRTGGGFSDEDNPAFVTEDASLSVVNFAPSPAVVNEYALWARETRNGETRTSERFSQGHVYSAFDDQELWDLRQEVVVDNLDPEVSLIGTWQSSTELPGGFLDSDVVFSSEAGATATFAPDLPVDGEYEVYVRWIDGFGVTSHTGHGNAVPVDIVHVGGTQSQTINQRTGGGKWVSLGQFDFDAGTGGTVTIGTEGTTENTIADGVRFILRSTSSTIPISAPFPILAVSDTYDSEIYSGGTYVFDGAEGLLANDIEDNGNPLTVSGSTPGIGGNVAVAPDGTLTYSPHPWFTGRDHFTYTVTNGTEQTIGNVEIVVEDPLDPVTGALRRDPTAAEILEASSTVIDGIRVEQFEGQLASALLGPGQRSDVGVSDRVGHERNGDGVFFRGPEDASATLDLGGRFRVDTVRIWNHNEQEESGFFLRRTNRGAAILNVYADTDADGNGAADNLTLVQTLNLAEASARADYTGEVFDLEGIEARFIRLEVVSTHGGTTAGLSEIEFRGEQIGEAGSPEVPIVFIQDVSSELNADRLAERTLTVGLDPVDNQHSSSSRGANWESAEDDPTPVITYDLTDLYELGSFRLWNYNFSSALNRGARSIDVWTSTDNVNYQLVSTIEPDPGSGQSTDNGQKYDLGGIVARYVRLDITESHGSTDIVGLGEVRFFGDLLESGDVLPVAGVTTSNTGFGFESVANLIDGSGLDADAQYHNNSPDARYTSNFDITPTLDFELEAPASIDKIHVWNYSQIQQTDRGVREMRVLTSLDGDSFVDQGVVEIERGAASQAFYHAINFQLAPVTARHVRFEVISTWGDTSFTGLGEVRFFGSELDTVPPLVEAIVIDDGTNQRSQVRSITVDFDSQVIADEGAFEVSDADGNPVEVTATTSIVNGKTRAVLEFTGSLVEGNGSLVDGNYQLRILASLLRDLAGNPLDGDEDGDAGGDATDEFFRLFGDSDGDRLVGLIDFAGLRRVFGTSTGDEDFESQFDHNGDGTIGLQDFAQFRGRFGTSV